MEAKNICDSEYVKLDDVTDFFVESSHDIRKITRTALNAKMQKVAVDSLDTYGSLLTEVEW